jgi:hypothetical protein
MYGFLETFSPTTPFVVRESLPVYFSSWLVDGPVLERQRAHQVRLDDLLDLHLVGLVIQRQVHVARPVDEDPVRARRRLVELAARDLQEVLEDVDRAARLDVAAVHDHRIEQAVQARLPKLEASVEAPTSSRIRLISSDAARDPGPRMSAVSS